MSNNYLQFSFQVDIPNESIRAWASDFLSYPKNHGKFEDAEDPGFNWDSWKKGIHIWSEDHGNVENVITFLSELLNLPDFTTKCVGFSYAFSSDQMRIGEFGGGAVKIIQTDAGIDIKYMNTNEWLTTCE